MQEVGSKLKQYKTVICDIDNVICDSREWAKTAPCCENDGSHNREAWDEHHKRIDLVKRNEDIESVFRFLIKNGLERVFFITSREDINGLRESSVRQIRDILQNLRGLSDVSLYLYMRNALDYRPAWLLKQETFLQKIFPYYYVDLVIDDDIKNIEMFKTYNIETLHYTKYLI